VIELLAPALVACLLLACVLSYFGYHVLMREVIFVDLALAQLAALGGALGHSFTEHADDSFTYIGSFALTFLGAAIFTWARPGEGRIPQEAVIGIVYGVSAALVILVLSQSALDRDEIEAMMTGRLLFAEWSEVGTMAGVFAAIATFHYVFRRVFLEHSHAHRDINKSDHNRWLDFLFYLSFGVVVTSAVQLAGVLVVFGLLIVPAASAAIFYTGVLQRLLGAWLIGSIACAIGIGASAQWDLPTGASVVTALGAVFACLAFAERFVNARRSDGPL
jgi:zinc/manganese transport system permease protein